MQLQTCVRFLFGADIRKAEQLIDDYMRKNSDWRIVSVSHTFVPSGVSVGIVLSYAGQKDAKFTEPSTM